MPLQTSVTQGQHTVFQKTNSVQLCAVCFANEGVLLTLRRSDYGPVKVSIGGWLLASYAIDLESQQTSSVIRFGD